MAIVKAAVRSGRRVKPVGSGRDRGGIGATDGIRISMARFDRVLRVDRERKLATVQAGISLRHLNVALAARGLALADFGGAGGAGRSVGGAIATAAPGTGIGRGGLATQVVGLDLVTAAGSVVTCSAREEPAIFAAARVSLGSLGVVATATLQCVAAFNLRSVTETADVADLLRDIDRHVDGNDHFGFSWLPQGGRAIVRRSNRTDEPAGGGCVDRGYRVLARSRRFHWNETEYSLPRAAVGPLLQRVNDQVAARRWSLPFPIRVGVTAGDDIPMSTATGRPSVLISFRGRRVDPAIEALLDQAGGRPQWGQHHHHGAAELRPRYPQWDAWQAVRRRLDPDERFANRYTRRVLG